MGNVVLSHIINVSDFYLLLNITNMMLMQNFKFMSTSCWKFNITDYNQEGWLVYKEPSITFGTGAAI
jgi:hypothetical protein